MVVVPLVRVGRTRAVDNHVQRVELANGAVLEVSAAHPIGDGRTFADLRAGSVLSDVSIGSTLAASTGGDELGVGAP